jgi:23S rRNA (cytidine1920-2'-O)/16S rRNA (cytidine1409-2'-O)-methyltransferase
MGVIDNVEEERLDKVLMDRNLVSTRVRAEQIIRESGVLVNGKLFTKPGKKVAVDATIELLAEEIPWVSRGALKLVRAIETWSLTFEGKTVLDIGASTGGFTEVTLSKGASKVFAVDVGKDQLHTRIKEDSRVVNLEKTHVRELTPRLITDEIDICVIDVSFISLEKIFPFIHTFLKPNAQVVALIKPQFEVGKEHVGKGGIVKNKALYPQVIEKIALEGKKNNLQALNSIESPILGGDGNMEFLMLLQKM